jgi:hypothetical protein
MTVYGYARVFAQHVAVGQPPLAGGFLNRPGKPCETPPKNVGRRRRVRQARC